MSSIDLNLLQHQSALKIKKEATATYIFDVVRNKYLVLQPEELVRQMLLHYLLTDKKYPLGKIAVEVGLIVNELQKRCDILLYDSQFRPYMIVECKAPAVLLNDAVLFQAATYNLPLKVPYIMISNGVSNFCARLDYEQQSFMILDEIPDPA
jgi:hypothetical protein